MSTPLTVKALKKEDFPDQADWIGPLFVVLNQFISEMSDGTAQGFTLGENFKAQIKTLVVQPRDSWVTLTPADLHNSWTTYQSNRAADFQPPRYKKDAQGRVWFSGLVASGTTGADDDTTAAFQLPAAYRPAKDLIFSATSATDGDGQVRVQAAGAVRVSRCSNTGYVSLDGISFEASDPTPVANSIYPIDFANTIPGRKVLGIWCLDARTLGQGGKIVGGSVGVDWEPHQDAGSGLQVRIKNLSNLTPGIRYQITLAVIGG